MEIHEYIASLNFTAVLSEKLMFVFYNVKWPHRLNKLHLF